MTPGEFLATLWQYKPEESYLLLWTWPNKRSHWFQDIAKAGEFAANANGHDVYVGVGLSNADHGPKHRCTSDEVAGIAGMWTDLDLKSEAHKKALPATIPDALYRQPRYPVCRHDSKRGTLFADTTVRTIRPLADR